MVESIPRLLTLSELAEKLRVSPHTIRSWVRKGTLQPVWFCRRLLFHPEEVARFLVEGKVNSSVSETSVPAAEDVHV